MKEIIEAILPFVEDAKPYIKILMVLYVAAHAIGLILLLIVLYIIYSMFTKE